jgi:hypothetical protein
VPATRQKRVFRASGAVHKYAARCLMLRCVGIVVGTPGLNNHTCSRRSAPRASSVLCSLPVAELDDLSCWLACCGCDCAQVMDAGLPWATVGSVAGVLAALLAGWQVQLQLSERREKRRLGPNSGRALASEADGLPAAVPLGCCPAKCE